MPAPAPNEPTPTEKINTHLAEVRSALAAQLDPTSPTFDQSANAKFNLMELWARQHAHQMETREEYVARIEAKAAEVDAHRAEAKALRAKLESIEGTEEFKAEKRKRLHAQRDAAAAELAKLDGQ